MWYRTRTLYSFDVFSFAFLVPLLRIYIYKKPFVSCICSFRSANENKKGSQKKCFSVWASMFHVVRLHAFSLGTSAARRCECQRESLFISMCQPCDWLTTCPAAHPVSANITTVQRITVRRSEKTDLQLPKPGEVYRFITPTKNWIIKYIYRISGSFI